MNQENQIEQQTYFDQDISQLIDDIEVREQDGPLKEMVKKLVFEALQEIEQKYGKDGEGTKPFHDASHTKEFIIDANHAFEAAKQKFPDFNLAGQDRLLLLLAGAHHDIEQMLGPEKNERASADALILKLENEPLIKQEEKQLLKQLIMVTWFNFIEHKQHLSNTGPITTKQDILERCMGSADLAALGNYERQQWRAARLAHELHLADNPQDWFNKQIAFLTKQKEYLQSAFKNFPWEVLYPDIDKNLALYQNLIAHYQQLIANGILPEEIMAKDKATSDMVKQRLNELMTKT